MSRIIQNDHKNPIISISVNTSLNHTIVFSNVVPPALLTPTKLTDLPIWISRTISNKALNFPYDNPLIVMDVFKYIDIYEEKDFPMFIYM